MESDPVPPSVARAGAARQRLRRWLASREDVAAVVLTRLGSAGLHAAATRFASAGPAGPEFTALRARVLRIERDVLAASRPPRRYGDVLGALDRVTTPPATGQPWPTEDDDGQLPPRPAVLEVT